MEAKERLVLSEHDPDAAPTGASADTPPSRGRADFEALLQLAEKLQKSQEKHTDDDYKLQAIRQVVAVLTIAALTISYSLNRHTSSIVDLGIGLTLAVNVWYSISMGQRARRRRREIQYDERDITEVVELLREIEPIFASQEDLSALERIAIRIRLSRFGIGASAREKAPPQERKEAHPRNGRADQVAKPL